MTENGKMPRNRDRAGPRAPWFVIVLAVAAGAAAMGWAIYESIRAAAG